MPRRFAYLYLIKMESEKIRSVVPEHVEYWKSLDLSGYVGGPFSDRSGGLIAFEAGSLEEATRISLNDPFVLQDLIEYKWIKEWIAE